MKPATFEYHRPTTAAEAADLLADHSNAELMAGNQSLGIVMANRLATPDHLIDLNTVGELAFVEEREGAIAVGAMTRHRTIERSELLAAKLPMLPESAEQIAGPSVRNRGTLGGSVGEADPAGNYPAALVALDASLEIVSAGDSREVPVSDYFIAYMFTDLAEDELITAAEIPTDPFPPDRTGMAFLELKPTAQTWPTVSAATAIRVADPDAENPQIEEARLALANAADVPLRVEDAEAELEGEPLSEGTLSAAAEKATAAANPHDEMHADSEFKVEVAGEYARRSLAKSYERATSATTESESDPESEFSPEP